jgi:integrase
MSKTRSEVEWEKFLINKTESTQKWNKRYLDVFLQDHNLTHEELFQLKLKGDRSPDPRDNNQVEKMINNSVINYMKNNKVKSSTARMIYYSVKNFLKSNGLRINEYYIDIPNVHHEGSKVASKEDILLIINASHTMYPEKIRALILFAKDSGLSVTEILNLKVKDYQNANLHKNHLEEEFLEFKPITRQKTGIIGYPHIGPESKEAIDRYLETRQDLKPDDPLFASANDTPLDDSSLRRTLIQTRESIPEIKRQITMHSLRKFHETYLEKSMPKNYIAKLQCKKINDTSSPYSNPQDLP